MGTVLFISWIPMQCIEEVDNETDLIAKGHVAGAIQEIFHLNLKYISLKYKSKRFMAKEI
jgi:hypothetical protein